MCQKLNLAGTGFILLSRSVQTSPADDINDYSFVLKKDQP